MRRWRWRSSLGGAPLPQLGAVVVERSSAPWRQTALTATDPRQVLLSRQCRLRRATWCPTPSVSRWQPWGSGPRRITSSGTSQGGLYETRSRYYVRGVTERWLRLRSGTLVEWRYLRCVIHVIPDSTSTGSVTLWATRHRQGDKQDVRIASFPLARSADTSSVSSTLFAAADALIALAIHLDDSPPDETQPLRSVPRERGGAP